MATLPPDNSIYDFIYLDLPRIRSYYAQMTGGIPTTSTDNQKATESTNYSIGADIGGSVDLATIVKGSSIIKGLRLTTSSDEESLGVTSDMIDKLPRDMINALNERNLIHGTLGDGNLGKLVLLKGHISIINSGLIVNSIEPLIDFYGKLNLPPDDRRELNEIKKLAPNLSKFFKSLPSRMIGYMVLDSQIQNGFVWMPLDDESLGHGEEYSMLKYDNCSMEPFYVLGILDSLPDSNIPEVTREKSLEYERNILGTGELNVFFKQMSSMFFNSVGRPKNCYSITPISIFRALGVASE